MFFFHRSLLVVSILTILVMSSFPNICLLFFFPSPLLFIFGMLSYLSKRQIDYWSVPSRVVSSNAAGRHPLRTNGINFSCTAVDCYSHYIYWISTDDAHSIVQWTGDTLCECHHNIRNIVAIDSYRQWKEMVRALFLSSSDNILLVLQTLLKFLREELHF